MGVIFILENRIIIMKSYNKNLKQASRDLRNNMTEAEKLLWSKLRGKKILEIMNIPTID